MRCSPRIRQLFEHPQHGGHLPENAAGRVVAQVGRAGYGEVIRLELQLDPRRQRIEAARFLAAGCGFLIAVAEWGCRKITGLSTAEALRLDHRSLAAELALPPAKIHCAALVTTAIAEAVAKASQRG